MTLVANFAASALSLILNGLASTDLVDLAIGDTLADSSNNINLIPAVPAVYPKKSTKDAPYSLPENILRSAIYIPPGFKYGKIPSILLIPGTGAKAGENFSPNFGKEFTGSTYADPVFLNVPNFLYDPIPQNAEFVAYAINYISAISGHKNISMLSWSQGSLCSQWALNYWPSTRSVVSNFIPISGDLHGTQLAYFICPGFPRNPCPPSVIQQEYNSRFIATLRNAGGSSAYVPTTSVYSAFDEIVQPQEGAGASAYTLDAGKVGVSNTELQNACTVAQPGGTLYTHEGVLYNALATALAKDALMHGGPGQLSRINVVSECQKLAADGLSLADVLATEATIPIALYELLAYPNKVLVEPPIPAYAQKDVPAGY